MKNFQLTNRCYNYNCINNVNNTIKLNKLMVRNTQEISNNIVHSLENAPVTAPLTVCDLIFLLVSLFH